MFHPSVRISHQLSKNFSILKPEVIFSDHFHLDKWQKADKKWDEKNTDESLSAVLIALCSHPKCGSPSLLYTKRSTGLRLHSGQVCFPGGRFEPGDSKPADTAIRETLEELPGISKAQIRLLGVLDETPAPRGGKSVTPVIARIESPVQLSPVNREEVFEAFCVPLHDLTDPTKCRYTQFRAADSDGYSLPVYDVKPYRIWGFTAILTMSFLRKLDPTYKHKMNFQRPWKKK